MSTFHKINLNAKGFAHYVRKSTYVHGALIALTLISSKVAYEITQKQKDMNLELIEASVRVDVVEMPKYTITELKNLSSGKEDQAPKVEETSKEELKEEASKEDLKEESKEVIAEKETTPDPVESFQEESKVKRKNFLAKLEKISNTKLPQEKAAPKAGAKPKDSKPKSGETGLGGVNTTALKDLVLAGNKLASGTAITGSGQAGELTAFQAYATRLPDLVRPHWSLPSYLIDKNLQCRIRVWLNTNGEVVKTEVYQSSGDAEYDKRATNAVKAASPFPKLSKEHGSRAQNGDILLGFPL